MIASPITAVYARYDGEPRFRPVLLWQEQTLSDPRQRFLPVRALVLDGDGQLVDATDIDGFSCYSHKQGPAKASTT
jgi:hypothetical protein